MPFDQIKRPLGIDLLDPDPVGLRDLASRIAADFGRNHANLNPQHMLAVRRTAGINRGGLPHHQHRLVRQQPGHSLLVGPRHLIERWRNMHIGE